MAPRGPTASTTLKSSTPTRATSAYTRSASHALVARRRAAAWLIGPVACAPWCVRGVRCGQFSPLTRVTLLEDAVQPRFYPFQVDTVGQRLFELAAESREDAADWVDAIQAEIVRLINVVLADYDAKGYHQYASLTQGYAPAFLRALRVQPARGADRG